MESRSSPHAQVTFVDVLRVLDMATADALFKHLESYDWLREARLAFKELRNIIDGSLKTLKFELDMQSDVVWKAGAMPSLSRWNRCSEIFMTVYAGDPDLDEMDLATQLLLPFASEQLSTRQRIKGLRIELGDPDGKHAEAAIARLVFWLPALQQLDVIGLGHAMSYDPLQQQLMYRALATLPDLNILRLPSYRGVEHIGVLAASLKLLDIDVEGGEDSDMDSEDGDPEKDCSMSKEAMAGVSQLTRLTQLDLRKCGPPLVPVNSRDRNNAGANNAAAAADAGHAGGDGGTAKDPIGGLPQLLDSLPPSLESLFLKWDGFVGQDLDFNMTFELQDGVCKALQVLNHDGWVLAENLAPLAPLLRACRVELQGLSFQGLEVNTSLSLRCVRELMCPSTRVTIEELAVSETDVAAEAVEVLGRPGKLEVYTTDEYLQLTLRSAGEQQRPLPPSLPAPLAPTSLLTAAALRQPHLPLPTADSVAGAVLQRMAAGSCQPSSTCQLLLVLQLPLRVQKGSESVSFSTPSAALNEVMRRIRRHAWKCAGGGGGESGDAGGSGLKTDAGGAGGMAGGDESADGAGNGSAGIALTAGVSGSGLTGDRVILPSTGAARDAVAVVSEAAGDDGCKSTTGDIGSRGCGDMSTDVEAGRADPLTGSGGGGGGGGDAGGGGSSRESGLRMRQVKLYKEQPTGSDGTAAALLVCSRKPGMTAAVMAAATAVAAKLSTQAAAAAEAPAEAVARVDAPQVFSVVPVIGDFLEALQQELQALWDNEDARRQVGEREWLRRLLGIWEQLSDLPPPVPL
ncbi:hypothetical protein Agub_g4940 [Astrephomene gubernaculifera]|uniref:Uncharacterized protein n=1 Tax=Astrephomene gubernaculifera TaxID=47775 RepID=A0AAD3DL15_9CHLO|nr:hypothetical protein Agub_g4940 [Astrephomene gubernaculifera]